MEGPSLKLAAQQLKPLRKQIVRTVSGNSKKDIARLKEKEVKDIFAWGKHLVFQFDTFAVRIHFLMFGTYEAEVDGVWVTGDYRRAREARMALTFDRGRINTYNCSIIFFEDKNLRMSYDFSRDVLSRAWDPAQALRAMRKQPNEQIADVLVDQDIFAGVGNIIKNEVLSLVRVSPKRHIKDIRPKKLREIVALARDFSQQFLAWRKKFVLRKHLKAHRKGTCPHCGHKMLREKTGKRMRWSYWCPVCQP